MTAIGLSMAVKPALADDSTDLKAQVKLLKAQLEAVERKQRQLEHDQEKQAAQTAQAEKTAQEARAQVTYGLPAKAISPAVSAHPGCIPLPGTESCFLFGGYVKVNAATDLKGHMDGTASFIPDISLNGSQLARRNPDFFMDAKESRINFATYTPTSLGEMKVFLSMDFYGDKAGNPYNSSSYDPRLREAYVSLGHWLFGQTWSTFMDLDTYPETLDFTGPVGLNFQRQAVVRYSTDLAGGTFAASVENAFSDFEGSSNITPYGGGFLPSKNAWDKMPDVAVKWSVDPSWGHFAISGIGRMITADGPFSFGDSGFCAASCLFTGNASTWGWGVLAGLGVKTIGKDLLTFQAGAGDGIGRYLYGSQDNNNGAGMIRNADGTFGLRATPTIEGTIGYKHVWNDEFRSNVAFAWTHYNNELPLDPGNSYKNLESVHANLIWAPLALQSVGHGVEFGLEYIYGRIEMDGPLPPGAAFIGNGIAAVDGQGSAGEAHRILATAKANF